MTNVFILDYKIKDNFITKIMFLGQAAERHKFYLRKTCLTFFCKRSHKNTIVNGLKRKIPFKVCESDGDTQIFPP